jgi:catechol 2,3-dioxygenase-like lactoylglutathione lyase family enzyme
MVSETSMFSHVTLGAHDLQRAIEFYDAALAPLGIRRVAKKYPGWAAWECPGEEARFWIGLPYNQQPASSGNGSMVAFRAESRAAVDAAYQAALEAGGRDEGRPGPRPSYGPTYYGAYVRDRDGNKVHFVCRDE